MKVKVAPSCLTLCNPVDYRVHGILQARILEWIAFPFSRGSSQPRDQSRSPTFQILNQLSHKRSLREATRETNTVLCVNYISIKVKGGGQNYCKIQLLFYQIGKNPKKVRQPCYWGRKETDILTYDCFLFFHLYKKRFIMKPWFTRLWRLRSPTIWSASQRLRAVPILTTLEPG